MRFRIGGPVTVDQPYSRQPTAHSLVRGCPVVAIKARVRQTTVLTRKRADWHTTECPAMLEPVLSQRDLTQQHRLAREREPLSRGLGSFPLLQEHLPLRAAADVGLTCGLLPTRVGGGRSGVQRRCPQGECLDQESRYTRRSVSGQPRAVQGPGLYQYLEHVR
jgi:hypothetical protein